jgi:protein O-mannosyl-transferase
MKKTHSRTRQAANRPGASARPVRGAGLPSDPAADGISNRRLLRWLIDLALAALTIAVYAPVGQHGFISLDDTAYVSENVHVARGVTPAGVAWALTSVSNLTANWHPVTWLSHMLDVELFGMNPGAHHLVSAALHALNAIVLFLLLDGMTGRPWRSACVAALFAAHPLHVESVAWIAERKDVLSTLFWLLTTWAYVGDTRRPGRARWAAVIVLFVLGLMAKPMLITLPFTLLLLDWWPLGRVSADKQEGRGAAASHWRRFVPLVVEKWPLFVLSGLSAVMTVIAQRRGGAVVALATISVAARVANAMISYVVYAWQMVWPAGLSVYYPHSGEASAGAAAVALAAVLGASWLAIRGAGRRPHLAVGWFWYLGTLVPVVGLVQVGLQAHADRYTYVPLIGLFVAIVWESADLARPRAWARVVVSTAACVLIGVCAATARVQVGYWGSEAELWNHALAVNPDNFYAHYSLGRLQLRSSRGDDAVPHLQRAVQLAPWFADAHDAMGIAWSRQGRFDAAIAEHREALRLKPGSVEATVNLGLAYEQRGDLAEAIEQYREAIRLDAGRAAVHTALGHALVRRGLPDDAGREFQEALKLQPGSALAHVGLGSVSAAKGQLDAALAHFSDAVRLDPESDVARVHLGMALGAKGDVEGCAAQLREALRINPGNQDARSALAMLAKNGGVK